MLVILASCRQDVVVFPTETEQHGQAQDIEKTDSTGVKRKLVGFYLLNEANMGSNKSTLDYYDFTTATYTRNIYGEANPTVVKELGDVGNDLQIYGERLYAVINVSGKVEVMRANDCVRIGQVDVPNCRYLCFQEGYMYVTSYAGPVSLDASHAQIGYVAKVDTATLAIVDTCYVGYQPEEMAIVGNKLYVANSGGYLKPNYETTVSVVDLTTFRETHRIEVAPNLHRLRKDARGGLWVTSRGDYYTSGSRLYYIDTATDELTDSVMTAAANLCIVGDSLYLFGSDYNAETYETVVSYAIVNTKTRQIVTHHFITDGTEEKIRVPYGLMVNPVTRDVYITDARNYVTPGYLYCYSPEGELQWNVRTGDIPAHFALYWR